MIKTLLARLLSATPGTAPTAEGDLALAALLVRLARADDRYEAAEQIQIERLLMRRMGLSHDEARALRAEAEDLETEAPDTVRFTRRLKEIIAHDDRIGVIEALWEIALADSDRSADEDALIRLVASLLGITDRDSALARQRVAARA